MAQAQQLQRLNQTGWRVGFGNLLRKENGEWWGTRKWLVHALTWFAIINGLVGTVLWLAPQTIEDEPDAPFSTPAQAVPDAMEIFFGLGGLATAVGVTIVMQGAIMDEKKSGTLEWILSKPVARPAVILTKWLAKGAGAIAVMVLLQGAIAYTQFALTGAPPDALRFIGGMGLLALHLLFYVTLTLMLGVVLNGRGPVIGLPLLFLFGYQLVAGMAPGIATWMPWGLVMTISPEIRGLAQMMVHGEALPTVLPIVATVGWIVVMLGVAIWRFDRTEF